MKKYEIAYHYYAEAKRASSAKIIYSNPASDIVHSFFKAQKKRKKIKVRLKSLRNCSVYVRITFDEMESSFAGFNHVCFQFRRGISSKVLSCLCWQFSISLAIPSLNTTFFPNRQPKGSAFYSV